MKLNRNSTEFNNNKQEFNVYKNVLRRLINQTKNIYYSQRCSGAGTHGNGVPT